MFVRDEPVTQGFYELVWDVTGDAADAHRLTEWWADALGGRAVQDAGFSHVADVVDLPFESIVFQPVPEEKTTKNRVHIDVTTADLEPLVAAGATVWRAKGDGGIGWTVMLDPAGNEFCAFTPD
ncbi:MAG: VOC family protein [Dermatophilaceae bacterium]|nr:VOC family protein [Dermatophilaceae bacterium]